MRRLLSFQDLSILNLDVVPRSGTRACKVESISKVESINKKNKKPSFAEMVMRDGSGRVKRSRERSGRRSRRDDDETVDPLKHQTISALAPAGA